MSNKIFNIRLRNKRDTEANWEKKNPLILDGEIIVVTTTSGETRVKIGDGAKTYTQLPFLDEVLKNESKSLGLTSATVGQIPKVKAVDSNGVPTEWEATAMPSGGSSDMIYVLDMVDGEGNTFTINNDFDEAVSAIDQGKVFVWNGTCLQAYYNADNGTVKTINLDIIDTNGYTISMTWNRGSSTVAFKLNLFPVVDPDAITTAGALYYDGSFKIKSAADLCGAYVVQVENDVLVNDYTEFEKAVKNGAPIAIKYGDTSYTTCTFCAYEDSSITCYRIIGSLLWAIKFDKSTKKQTDVAFSELDNVYLISIDKDSNVANDYDELDNAIKRNKSIYVKDNDGHLFSCTHISREESQIQFGILYSMTAINFVVNKNTKETTTETYYLPSIPISNVSQSGYVYYDKTKGECSIKDATPPIATASTAGTIKVGRGLSISAGGTLSVTTATYYTGTSDPVDTLGADGDLYLQTEG